MSENNQKERKPKSNGIIGRTSNEVIKQRKEICQKLLRSNPEITKKEFLSAFINTLKRKGYKIPTEQTLIKIAKSCGYHFKHHFAETDYEDTTLQSLGYDIGYYLRQIRIICKSFDIKLFDESTFSDTITKEEFLKPLDKLKNTKTKISKSRSVCLCFIFNLRGFEKYVEDVLYSEFNDYNGTYLYSETHSCCTKIFFEFRRLDDIMNKIYEIVEIIETIDT